MIVNANGIECRALVDTGAGSSYTSVALISCIDTNSIRQERRQIEMLLHTTSKKTEVRNFTIGNQECSFRLNVDI